MTALDLAVAETISECVLNTLRGVAALAEARADETDSAALAEFAAEIRAGVAEIERLRS